MQWARASMKSGWMTDTDNKRRHTENEEKKRKESQQQQKRGLAQTIVDTNTVRGPTRQPPKLRDNSKALPAKNVLVVVSIQIWTDTSLRAEVERRN